MPAKSPTSPRLKGRSSAETRGAVLDLIRSEGEISRTDLARRSALTEKTISVIVKSLLDAGVVVESGFAKSTGGKRPVLLRLNDKELYAIGITLDISRCVIVLCALDGAELARSEVRGIGLDRPASVLKRIAGAVQRLLARRHVGTDAIVGIGVASGGRRGSPLGWQVDAAFADCWEPYPTEQELERLTGLTVLRENDANCAALGEYWTTESSPARAFATIYMAHGIGCGIVVAGSIYRGSSGNAGEIGHTLADPAGRSAGVAGEAASTRWRARGRSRSRSAPTRISGPPAGSLPIRSSVRSTGGSVRVLERVTNRPGCCSSRPRITWPGRSAIW